MFVDTQTKKAHAYHAGILNNFGPTLFSAAAAHTSEPILEIGNDADGLLKNGELGKRRRRCTGVHRDHLTKLTNCIVYVTYTQPSIIHVSFTCMTAVAFLRGAKTDRAIARNLFPGRG